jgi:hypothetical protein
MPKNTPQEPEGRSPQQHGQSGPTTGGSAFEATTNLEQLIRTLAALGSNAFSQLPDKKIDTAAELNKKLRVTVAFPPCTDELLALNNGTDTSDEINRFYNEYFTPVRHRIFGQDPGDPPVELDTQLPNHLDPRAVSCLNDEIIVEAIPQSQHSQQYGPVAWPTECCLCPPCVTLDGNRNPPPNPPFTTVPHLKRLFVGDVLWAYFFDRMGIHQILGVILDAFASTGRLPISNGSIELGVRDDIVALVLEVMVRQTKTGLSSTVRDRGSMYRTTLGWTSEGGRKLNLDTEVNTGFNTLFHKFIFHSLEFYRDKRLAVAIQGASGGIARPSVATLVTIKETIEVLKKRFEAFQYGRNYYNALSAIVWTIAGMSIVRELRTTLGIPPAFNAPDEFISAAYDILVLKRPVTQGAANRFIVHRECATQGRNLLLDLEVVNHLDANPGGQLEEWLTQVEATVEAYRTNYLTLTGADLGVATAAIDQQA